MKTFVKTIVLVSFLLSSISLKAQTWIYEANTASGMIYGVMRQTSQGFTFQIGQNKPINFIYSGMADNVYCYQSTNMSGQQINGYKSSDASRVQIGNIVFLYSSRNVQPYNSPTDNYNDNSRRQRFITEDCSYCKGSKLSPQREYVTQYNGNMTYSYCSHCKEYNITHWHKPCPACGGSGKQKRSVYE